MLIMRFMKVNDRFSRHSSRLMGQCSASVGMAVIVAAIFFASKITTQAADTNAPASTVTVKTTQASQTKAIAKPTKAASAKSEKNREMKKPQVQISGAELYAVNCNRCHPERDPSEFTASQWKTMMIYMRVRANIPANQARAITKYLEDQAGQ